MVAVSLAPLSTIPLRSPCLIHIHHQAVPLAVPRKGVKRHQPVVEWCASGVWSHFPNNVHDRLQVSARALPFRLGERHEHELWFLDVELVARRGEGRRWPAGVSGGGGGAVMAATMAHT